MFNSKSEKFIVLAMFCAIGVLLTLRQCNSPSGVDSGLNQRKDTSWVDTIIVPYKVIEFKEVVKPIHDTLYKLPEWVPIDSLFFTRNYSDSLVDSNQTVFYSARVFGMLDNLDIKYRLKIPSIIKETREINDTKFVPNKFSISGTGMVGGNLNTFNMYVGVDVRIKKAIWGYNYGIIDKTHNIRLGYVLFNSKK